MTSDCNANFDEQASNSHQSRWRRILSRTMIWSPWMLSALITIYFIPILFEVHEIDIANGRLRIQKRLFGVTLSEEIRETILSEVRRGCGSEVGPADWRRVYLLRIGGRRVSPQYPYHGALTGCQIMSDALHEGRFDIKAKCFAASRFLHLLREFDQSSQANVFALKMRDLARATSGHGQAIDVPAIEEWERRPSG